MKFKMNLHKWQAISLILALLLLFVGIPGVEHMTNMIISGVIIGGNAIIEWRF